MLRTVKWIAAVAAMLPRAVGQAPTPYPGAGPTPSPQQAAQQASAAASQAGVSGANQAVLMGTFANYQDAREQKNDDQCYEIVYGPSGGSKSGQPIQDDLIDARFTKDTAFYAAAFTIWIPILGCMWVHWFVNPVPSHKTQKKVKSMSIMRFARGWGFLFCAQYMTIKKNNAPKFWQQFTEEADKQIDRLYVNMIIEFVLTILTNILVGLPKQLRQKWMPSFLVYGVRKLLLKQVITIGIFFLLLVQVFTTFESLVKIADMCKPYLLALNVDFQMIYVLIVVLYIMHHQNVYVMICHMTHLKKHDHMLTALEHYDVMHLVNDFEQWGLLKPSYMSGLAREDLLTLLQKEHVTIEDPFKVSNLIDFHTKQMAGRFAPVGIARQILIKGTNNIDVDGIYELQRFSLYYKGRHVWKNAKGRYLYFKPGWKSVDFFYGMADLVCRCCLGFCGIFASQNILGMSTWCVSSEIGASRSKSEMFYLDYWHADDPTGIFDPLQRGITIETVEPVDIIITGGKDEEVNGIYSLMPADFEWEGRRVWKQDQVNGLYMFFARTKGRNERIYKSLPRCVLAILHLLPKCCQPKVKPPGWYIAQQISDPATITPIFFLPDPDCRNNPTLCNDLAEDGVSDATQQIMFAELSIAKEDFRGSQSTCEKCGKPSETRYCKECKAEMATSPKGGGMMKLTSTIKSVNSLRNSASGGGGPQQPETPVNGAPTIGGAESASPPVAAAAAPKAAAPAAAAAQDPELASKLANLQKLKDCGAIDDAEYAKMKAEAENGPKLKELQQLKDCGAIDDAEYNQMKANLLGAQPGVTKVASAKSMSGQSPAVSDISEIQAGPSTVAAAKAVAQPKAVARVTSTGSTGSAVATARPAAAAMTPETQAKLKELQDLKNAGILDDAEYEAGRKSLMAKASASQSQVSLPGALPPGPALQ